MKNTSILCTFFVFFFLAAFSTEIQGQKADPKCADWYRQSASKFLARDFKQGHLLADSAMACFLAIHDTIRICRVLHLKATYSGDQPDTAIALLDRAIQYYEDAHLGVDFTYFKVMSAKIQMTMSLGRFQAAIDQSNEIARLEESLIANDPGKGCEAVFEKDVFLANNYQQYGLYQDGVEILEKTLAFHEREGRFAQGQLLANAYSILSQLYRKLGDLPKASEFNEFARGLLGKEPKKTAQIVQNLLGYQNDYALILEDAEKYQEACDLLQQVILDKKAQPFATEADLVNNYANLGHVYLKMMELQLAADYTGRALKLYTAADVPPVQSLALVNVNMSIIQRKQQRPMEALHHARAATNVLKQHAVERGQTISLAWKETAMCYLALGMQDSCRAALEKASAASEINVAGHTARDGQRMVGAAWHSFAKANSPSMKDSSLLVIATSPESCWTDVLSPLCKSYFDSALVCMQRALDACYRNPGYRYEASEVPFGFIFAEDPYLLALAGMGAIYRHLYDYSGQTSCLKNSFHCYYRCAAMLAYMDAGRTSAGLHHYKWEMLWKRHQPIVQAGVEVAVALWKETWEQQYLTAALAMADLNKGRQVAKRQAIALETAHGRFPLEFVQKERAIQQRLDRRRNAVGVLRDEKEALEVIQEIAADASMLEQMRDSLRKKSPLAYRQRFENQANFEFTRMAISRPLSAREAELEYFVAGDSVYAFLKTADSLTVAIIPDRESLAALVDTFVHQISKDRHEPKSVFAPTAAQLWRRLLPFQTPRLPIDRVCIIPDDFLSKLPFQALVHPSSLASVTESGPIYLMELTALHYDFSLTTQYAALMAPTSAVGQIEGFFPQSPLMELNDSTHNMDTIAWPIAPTTELEAFSEDNVFKYNGDQATSRSFLDKLGHPNLIEITTHGMVTEKDGLSDGFLVLRDQKGNIQHLMASDLYNLPGVETRLVVLNACLMSRGRYVPGEGTLSMTYALRLAGCPTVLASPATTVPEANDDLLKQFYQELQNGQSAAQALRIAQCLTIHHDQTTMRHPCYWASFSLYGRADEVTFEYEKAADTSKWLAIIVVALLAMGWLLRWAVSKVRLRI